MEVYLAGGFHSGWQDRVMATRSADYLDPRSHSLLCPDAYLVWDLDAIRRCDIVFAYMECSNPGGYALATEIGFAKGLKKCIVLIDEKSYENPEFSRYWQMTRACADMLFETLDNALEWWEHFDG